MCGLEGPWTARVQLCDLGEMFLLHGEEQRFPQGVLANAHLIACIFKACLSEAATPTSAYSNVIRSHLMLFTCDAQQNAFG